MRTLLGVTGAAALALAACGGNVVVDGASAGGGAPTTSTFVTTTDTVVTTTGEPTMTADCSPTCSATISIGGPPPCGGTGLSAYDTLLSCGCGNGPCQAECGANFCLHEPPSTPCATCLQAASCASAFQICTTN